MCRLKLSIANCFRRVYNNVIPDSFLKLFKFALETIKAHVNLAFLDSIIPFVFERSLFIHWSKYYVIVWYKFLTRIKTTVTFKISQML